MIAFVVVVVALVGIALMFFLSYKPWKQKYLTSRYLEKYNKDKVVGQ